MIQHSGNRSFNNLCMHGLRSGEFKDLACLNVLIGNLGHKPSKNLRMQGLRIKWHLDLGGSLEPVNQT